MARIISKTTKSRFIELSATSHGASDVRKAFDEAKGHLSLTGQRTIVFIDEIHRFTKAQQDLFLPYVESGQIRLIGATTENPSFKVNGALLSRCRVFVLKQLTVDHVTSILTKALLKWRHYHHHDEEKQHDLEQIDESEKEALTFLSTFSDGDGKEEVEEKKDICCLTAYIVFYYYYRFSKKRFKYIRNCLEYITLQGITIKYRIH